MKHIKYKLLVLLLLTISITSIGQNKDPRWEKIQVIEKEIAQFISNKISEIKLSKKEIRKIRRSEKRENLSIDDIKKMKIAIEKNKLRRLFFEQNPQKKEAYLAKPVTKSTRQTGCTNGDFENGSFANYNFYSRVNWNHTGGDNVAFGANIPIGPGLFNDPVLNPNNITLTNPGLDPILNLIPTTFNGSNHSLRLNPINSNQEDATILTRNFIINQPTISLNFAVIFDNPNHPVGNNPFVRFEVFDNVLNTVVDQRVITSISANGTLTNFNTNNWHNWRYAPWSCLDLDVSQSIGNNVTLRVYISDCSDTIHDAILYLDDICNNGSACATSFFGNINLNPQGINCPSSTFQVCGSFEEASGTVSTAITLNITNNSGIVSTLTNPSINNSNNTFCFDVNPSNFGTNPNGNYEFVANATFTNSNGDNTFTSDNGSNTGPDVSFNNCITCDDLNADFNAYINSNGNLVVTDFELFNILNPTHEWYVISSTDTSTNYTPVYSGYSTTSAPFTLINNAQPDVHYTIIHKVYSDDCEDVCKAKTYTYNNHGENKINSSNDCCLAFEYWPNGPEDISNLTVFNAEFDATISLSGTLTVFDFDLFDYANATHSWKVYSSTTFIGPYTNLVSSTITTNSGPIDLISNLQEGLFYGIKHEVITDCATICEDGVLFYSANKKNRIINSNERSSLCCDTFDDLITLTDPTNNILSGNTENYDTYFNIVASNKIEVNANSTYKVNETIVLKNGFHAKYNSTFHAYILPCDYVVNPKRKVVENNSNDEKEEFNKTNLSFDYIKLYPNPTKGFITVESTKEVNNWILTDAYGKFYFKGTHAQTKIDMSNLPKGIYFLKAVLVSGKVVMKKVIKN